MEKKEYVILALVLAGALLLENYILDSKMKRIIDEVRSVKTEMSAIREEMRGVDSRVARTLREFQKENSWLAESDAEITGFDKEEMSFTGVSTFILNEDDQDSEISLMYSMVDEDGESGAWNEIALEKSQSLAYRVEMKLDPKYDYQLRVKSKSGEVVKTGELRGFSIRSNFEDRMNADVHMREMGSIGKKNTMEFDFNIDSFYGKFYDASKKKELKDMLRIKDIRIMVKEDGKDDILIDEYLYKDGKNVLEGEDKELRIDQDKRGDYENFSGKLKYEFETSVEGSETFIEIVFELTDYMGNKYLVDGSRW